MAQDVVQDPPVGATTEDINDEITTHEAIVEAHQAEYLDADAVAACDGVVDAATLNGKAEGSLSVDDASKLGGTAASSYALDADVPSVPSSTGSQSFDAGYFPVFGLDSPGYSDGDTGTGSGFDHGTATDVEIDSRPCDGCRIYFNDDGNASGSEISDITVVFTDASTETVTSGPGSLNTFNEYSHTAGVVDRYEITMVEDFGTYGISVKEFQPHYLALAEHSHSI